MSMSSPCMLCSHAGCRQMQPTPAVRHAVGALGTTMPAVFLQRAIRVPHGRSVHTCVVLAAASQVAGVQTVQSSWQGYVVECIANSRQGQQAVCGNSQCSLQGGFRLNSHDPDVATLHAADNGGPGWAGGGGAQSWRPQGGGCHAAEASPCGCIILAQQAYWSYSRPAVPLGSRPYGANQHFETNWRFATRGCVAVPAVAGLDSPREATPGLRSLPYPVRQPSEDRPIPYGGAPCMAEDMCTHPVQPAG